MDQGKLRAFLKDPVLIKELLHLSRNRLRIVMGLLTGHCNLKGRYANWGAVSPRCNRCKRAFEQPHMFFLTEPLAILHDLGTWANLKPGDFSDISISKVPHFVQSVGLLNLRQRVAQKDQEQSRCKDPCGACPNLL